MLELSLRSFLSEFNGSKFVVYTSLLFFTIFIALKLDETVDTSYVLVFAPIWFGEMVVFMGFLVGMVGFCTQPPSRYDASSRVDFVCMCLTTIQHICLVCFEVLCVYKLEYGREDREFSWSLVCAPLFLESIIAMVIAVWAVRHDKTFEFEMFFAINVVQFVFVAFKLDNTLHWSWVVVFVPTWVLFSLGVVGTLYTLILSVFLTRSLHALQHHRRAQVYTSACHLILAVPLITFFVLLTAKLDTLRWLDDPAVMFALPHSLPTPSPSTTPSTPTATTPAPSQSTLHALKVGHLSFLTIGWPLFMAFCLMILMSFGTPSGNTWWFAMRKPFCNFIFDAFPCLRQYANISYRIGVQDQRVQQPGTTLEDQTQYQGPPRTLSTIRMTTHMWSIETPD